MGFLKKSVWQRWIWPLFTSRWVVYSDSSYTNVGNDLRVCLNSRCEQLQWITGVF